jgi:hypothetical protein
MRCWNSMAAPSGIDGTWKLGERANPGQLN